jgi:diguanylate cyclase (GGDEF)-like protein
LLNHATSGDAVKRVDQWRARLEENPLSMEGGGAVPIRFTAGIASLPAHGGSMEEVLNYADVALYRAKAEGRNRTAVFS